MPDPTHNGHGRTTALGAFTTLSLRRERGVGAPFREWRGSGYLILEQLGVQVPATEPRAARHQRPELWLASPGRRPSVPPCGGYRRSSTRSTTEPSARKKQRRLRRRVRPPAPY